LGRMEEQPPDQPKRIFYRAFAGGEVMEGSFEQPALGITITLPIWTWADFVLFYPEVKMAEVKDAPLSEEALETILRRQGCECERAEPDETRYFHHDAIAASELPIDCSVTRLVAEVRRVRDMARAALAREEDGIAGAMEGYSEEHAEWLRTLLGQPSLLNSK
jgi:hypothetical protein